MPRSPALQCRRRDATQRKAGNPIPASGFHSVATSIRLLYWTYVAPPPNPVVVKPQPGIFAAMLTVVDRGVPRTGPRVNRNVWEDDTPQPYRVLYGVSRGLLGRDDLLVATTAVQYRDGSI
jgi:hypothetical protein